MELSQMSPENTEIKNTTNNTSEMGNETNIINDTINTETAPATAASNDSDSKIFSIDGECLFEGLDITNDDNQNTFQELIDFEELIDLTRDPNDIKETIQHIKEFENVLSQFETSKVCVNDVEDIVNLDDIFNDILDNDTGSDDLDALKPDEQSDKVRTSNKDNASENMPDSNEHLLQSSKCTDVDNPDSKTPTNKEVISKEHKPDLIYVISDEETQSISSDGYNSSDFEFITETEAKMDGYIINFSKNETNDAKNEIESKSADEIESSQSDECRDYASQIINENRHTTGHVNGSNELKSQEEKYSKYYKQRNAMLAEDPGEGPSGSNGPIFDYSDRNYRQNHVVPEEGDYLDLFQGQYNPVLPVSDIILLENKSIRPSPMNSRYEGIGFDKLIIWRNCQPEDSSEEEYGDEAKESLNKILSMYPDDNRKPRRRRR